MRTATLLISLAVLSGAILSIAPPAAAQPGEEDVEHMQAKIRSLIDKAAALEEAGRHEEAQKLFRQAEELGEKLHGMTRREGEGEGEGLRRISRDEARELLGDLERGARALKRLGRTEQAEAVMKVYKDLAARLREAEQKDRRPPEPKPETTEREIVKRHLDIMRSAMPALREGEKKDAAEILERGIHARELMLADRRDDEARQIIRKAPGPGDLGEILLLAADLWAGFGHETKAKHCHELGNHFREIARKARDRHPDRTQEDTMRRLDDLQERLAEMQRGMEEILEEMQKIRHEVR